MSGSVVIGRDLKAAEGVERELMSKERLECVMKVSKKATDLVAMSDETAYGWCDLKRDLAVTTLWYDDEATYVRALYGAHQWVRNFGNYGVWVGLTQRIVFAVVSLLGNMRVVWFHWMTPAHPKFTLDPLNRLAIKAHVVSGSLNVVVPLVAMFSPSWLGRALMFAVCVFELVHCGTALRMMPNVFGSKILMTPGYASRGRGREL